MLVKNLLFQYARYNQWAHQRLLDLMKSLSADQHHAVVSSSFNSLYKTVLHMEVKVYTGAQRRTAKHPGIPLKDRGKSFEGIEEIVSNG
jgi:uncharacterized damage-inducible protein DinB